MNCFFLIEKEMSKQDSVYSKIYSLEEYSQMMAKSWMDAAAHQYRRGWHHLAAGALDIANSYSFNTSWMVNGVDMVVDSVDGPIAVKFDINQE